MDDASEFDFFEFLRFTWLFVEIKKAHDRIDELLRQQAMPMWPGLTAGPNGWEWFKEDKPTP